MRPQTKTENSSPWKSTEKIIIVNEKGYVEKIIEKVKTKEHSKQIFAE